MKHFLTKNEARLLRTVDCYHGSFLYELASVAELTPTDAFETAERLDARGYLHLDRDKRFVTITGKGMDINQDTSGSSLAVPELCVRGPYVITANDVPRSWYEEMSERDVSMAIDAELEKYT